MFKIRIKRLVYLRDQAIFITGVGPVQNEMEPAVFSWSKTNGPGLSYYSNPWNRIFFKSRFRHNISCPRPNILCDRHNISCSRLVILCAQL